MARLATGEGAHALLLHLGMERDLALALLAVGLFHSGAAQAQCGATRTSCSACHDGTRAGAPRPGAWHENHAFADLCAACHGGHGDLTDVAGAHVGLADPFANTDETCGSCHGASTAAYVARYRSQAQGPLDAGAPAGSGGGARTRATSALHGDDGANAAMGVVIGAVGALGLLFALRNERARSLRAAFPATGH